MKKKTAFTLTEYSVRFDQAKTVFVELNGNIVTMTREDAIHLMSLLANVIYLAKED